MEHEKLKFVIYAPSFDENVGGYIVLHKLCDLLNRNNQDAYIYKSYPNKVEFDKQKPLKSIYKFLRYIKRDRLKKYCLNKALLTPLYLNKKIDDNCVVIYSETVNGNPLNAEKVVRWFLHKPGFHSGVINYGKNELYFFYQIIFNDLNINPYENHLLTVSWFRDDIYKQTNFGDRSGTCYMIRKGKNRQVVHDVKNSILLDGKSHKEIAKIMNECEFFISYDMETMYSQYAVLCGCKSIVIPKDGILKDEWQPKKEFQYGIAYGFEDIKESEKTSHLVYDILKKEEANSNESVKFFIKKVYEFFGSTK
jgi:hypothetical protein